MRIFPDNLSIAVLMTCFNRKDKTLDCLKNIFKLWEGVDVYLTNDKCTDGTFEAVKQQFPLVNIISGTGNLFWSRGMNLAWKTALKKNYSYYIWLNDDVIVYENSLLELLSCSKLFDDKAIISGIIESQDSQEILYGGYDANKKLIFPNGKLQEINNLNGNVVLIPRYVYHKIGIIDPLYHHDLGDVDYGLQALKNNLKVLSTRCIIGSCNTNKLCRVRLQNSNIFNRFRTLYSPLGANPLINYYFRKKNYGIINSWIYFIYIHIINILPDKFIKFFLKGRYFNEFY